MKVTLIIGNGFDLSLGLPTSYNHFIESDSFLRHIYSNLLFNAIKEKKDVHNWIDIENFLGEYGEAHPYDTKSTKYMFKKEYRLLCESLKEYLSTISITGINSSNSSYRILEEALAKIPDVVETNNDSSHCLNILDFNYTNSISSFLADTNFKEYVVRRKKIFHFQVHGSLKNNNIIFGVQDGKDIGNNIFIRKSYHDNYEQFDCNIYDLLKTSQRIIFFGYSLGESDHTYFQKYFENLLIQNGANIDFYYFQEKDDIFRALELLTNKNVGTLRSNHTIRFIDSSKEILPI